MDSTTSSVCSCLRPNKVLSVRFTGTYCVFYGCAVLNHASNYKECPHIDTKYIIEICREIGINIMCGK